MKNVPRTQFYTSLRGLYRESAFAVGLTLFGVILFVIIGITSMQVVSDPQVALVIAAAIVLPLLVLSYIALMPVIYAEVRTKTAKSLEVYSPRTLWSPNSSSPAIDSNTKMLVETATNPVPEFVRIRLRRWDSVYPQLNGNYPWRAAADELHNAWRPGHTAITWVSSQPLAKPGAAIRMAANSNVRPTVRLRCNMEDYRNATVRANLWRTLYTELVNRLQEPPADPGASSADVLIQWIAQLCRRHHQRCIVLVIQNADLLDSVFQPSSRADRLVERLCRMEREIPNFALTLESSDAPDERQQWEHRMGTVPLQAIYLPLLSLAGTGGWLQRQFDPAGVFAEASAVQGVYWFTGGHPYLLENLARGMAAVYNEHLRATPPSPVFNLTDVHSASVDTNYVAAVRRYSLALARTLRRHEDADVRFILDRLADHAHLPERPVSADELATFAVDHFRPIDVAKINRMLASWEALEVVERREQGGVASYLLRSYSFAQWLQLQGYTGRIHEEDGTTAVQHFGLEDGAVLLDADVREYFPDSESVNAALRSLIALIAARQPRRRRAGPAAPRQSSVGG